MSINYCLELCSHLFCRGRRPRRPGLKNIFNISGGASPSPTANLCLEVFFGGITPTAVGYTSSPPSAELPLKGKPSLSYFLPGNYTLKGDFQKTLFANYTSAQAFESLPLEGKVPSDYEADEV